MLKIFIFINKNVIFIAKRSLKFTESLRTEYTRLFRNSNENIRGNQHFIQKRKILLKLGPIRRNLSPLNRGINPLLRQIPQKNNFSGQQFRRNP